MINFNVVQYLIAYDNNAIDILCQNPVYCIAMYWCSTFHPPCTCALRSVTKYVTATGENVKPTTERGVVFY